MASQLLSVWLTRKWITFDIMKLTAAWACACFPQLPNPSPSMADATPHRHHISACAYLAISLRLAMFVPPPAVYGRFRTGLKRWPHCASWHAPDLTYHTFEKVRRSAKATSSWYTKQVTGHEGTQLQLTSTHIGLVQWCPAARGHICKLCVCVYIIEVLHINLGG